MQRVKEWWRHDGPRAVTACAVVALFAYAFASRLALLFQSPFPLGIDGYWYPIQLRSLLRDGHLYYPTAPLVPWLMAPLAWCTDPIVGAKLGAALGTSVMVVPAYLIGKRLSGDRALGILSSALAATSAESFFLTTEFVKEGVGLSICAGFLAAQAWALEKPSVRRILLPALLFAAAALAHKTAVALALVVGLFPLLAWAHARNQGNARTLARVLLLVLGALSLLALLGRAWPQRFFASRDLDHLRDLFRSAGDASLPVLAIPGRRPLYLGHEVLVAAVIAAVLALFTISRALARRARRRAGSIRMGEQQNLNAPPALAVGLVVLALFLGIPWLDARSEQGVVFRMRLAAFLPLGPLAALLLALVLRRATPRARATLGLGAALLLLLARHACPPTDGVVLTHPSLAAAVGNLKDVLPPGTTVVTPERHIVYMVTWYTGAPARLRLPAVNPHPAEVTRLLPGAAIRQELRSVLESLEKVPLPGIVPPRDVHPTHRYGLVVMPEATFQRIIELLPPVARDSYVKWRIY